MNAPKDDQGERDSRFNCETRTSSTEGRKGPETETTRCSPAVILIKVQVYHRTSVHSQGDSRLLLDMKQLSVLRDTHLLRGTKNH